MSKIEKLIMACNDMTEVLTLEPAIETDDKSQMRLDLVEAAKLLKSSDMSKLKDVTIAVLEKLGVELPKKEKKEKEKEKKEMKKEKAEKKEMKKEEKLKKKGSKKLEKNKYGVVEGSLPDLFVKSLIASPKKMSEIKKEKWNKTGATFYSPWKKILVLNLGFVNKEGKLTIKK